jgi:hypothetical protein
MKGDGHYVSTYTLHCQLFFENVNPLSHNHFIHIRLRYYQVTNNGPTDPLSFQTVFALYLFQHGGIPEKSIYFSVDKMDGNA